jgi:hypothetical protein
VPVVVAAVVAIAILSWPRDEPVTPSVVPSTSERTPAFAFAVRRSGALPTAQLKIRKRVGTNPELRLHGTSKLASKRAIASITRVYREGFLDPANWRNGSYAGLWGTFAASERAEARRDVRILTAGPAAGDAYLAIVPRGSTVRTTVLLDRKGKPFVVLVDARFRAVGRRVAGSFRTKFESSGRFFFQRVGGGWRIVSYDVRRSDERVGHPASGASGSPTEAAG